MVLFFNFNNELNLRIRVTYQLKIIMIKRFEIDFSPYCELHIG